MACETMELSSISFLEIPSLIALRPGTMNSKQHKVLGRQPVWKSSLMEPAQVGSDVLLPKEEDEKHFWIFDIKLFNKKRSLAEWGKGLYHLTLICSVGLGSNPSSRFSSNNSVKGNGGRFRSQHR